MNAINEFLTYARSYDTSDGRVRLKIIHTLGVLGNMRALCLLEHIEGDLKTAAETAAVFHDVGRFEQLRRYDTFFDSQSVDHAALSAQIVRENGWLEHSPYEKEILTAIECHNRLDDRPHNPTAALLYDLVRDADKLDILRVFAVDDVRDMTSYDSRDMKQSFASDAVLKDLYAGRPVDKRHRQTPIDIWLTYLGFLNDLHFDSARKLCECTGFWKKRFEESRFEDPRIMELVKFMGSRL